MFLFLRDFTSLKAVAEQYRQPLEPACGNHVLVSSCSSTELKPRLQGVRGPKYWVVWQKLLMLSEPHSATFPRRAVENVTEQKGRSWLTAASLAAICMVLVSRKALRLGGSTTATSLIWTFADIYSDIHCKTVSLSRQHHPAFLDVSFTNQFCKTSRWPNYFLCFEEKCCALPFSPCNVSMLYHVAPCEDSWPSSSWVLWVQVQCCAQVKCSCEVMLFL